MINEVKTRVKDVDDSLQNGVLMKTWKPQYSVDSWSLYTKTRRKDSNFAEAEYLGNTNELITISA